MFSFNPEMAIGDSMDDGEEAFDSYIRDEDEEANGNENVSISKSPIYYNINHQIINWLILKIFYLNFLKNSSKLIKIFIASIKY